MSQSENQGEFPDRWILENHAPAWFFLGCHGPTVTEPLFRSRNGS